MRRFKSFKIVLMLFLMVALVFACASQAEFSKNTYRALALQATAYDTAMKAAGDLYRAGKINAEKKAEIVNAASVYQKSYHSAVDAMTSWERAPAEQKADKLATAQLASKLLTTLFSRLAEILGPLCVALTEK